MKIACETTEPSVLPQDSSGREQIVTAVRRIGWVLGMILCLLVGLTGGAAMGWAAGEILRWSARF
jgi:hypothetical protein